MSLGYKPDSVIKLLHKTKLKCPNCGWELLADDISKVVFCQNPKCKINGKFRRVMP